MHRSVRLPGPWVLAGLLFLALGCAPRGYVVEPSSWVETADWSRAERVRVEVTEHGFAPQVLTLREGKAYLLEIANAGSEPHAFAAPDFFRAVALREVRVVGAASLDASRFSVVRVEPGQTVVTSLVAVRPDDYPVVCTVSGHRERGMSGALRILPKAKAP
ncbi:MAG: hypothetical protein AB1578_06545 [Thermodesulfobacteriota bacterium]